MKKLMINLVVLVLSIFFVTNCGVGNEDANCLDDFFNVYYQECVQLCETCSTWTDFCGTKGDSITICVEKQWYEGLRNKDCAAYIDEINQYINSGECHPESDRCLLNHPTP